TGGKMGGMAGGEGGGMMGGMMEGMHKLPPKELYPALMDLPNLTPEQRDEVRRQAEARMHEGTAMLSEALDQLSRAAEQEDYAAMQEATAQLREGLAHFDSGLAAQRALAEGQPPREVALRWFKREMNLLPPAATDTPSGLFGLSWFHFFVMVVLIGFTAVMI